MSLALSHRRKTARRVRVLYQGLKPGGRPGVRPVACTTWMPGDVMSNSVFEKCLFTLAALALLLFGFGAPAGAQAVQSVYSPVITLYDCLHP